MGFTEIRKHGHAKRGLMNLRTYGFTEIEAGSKEYLLTDDTTNVDVTDCDTLLKEIRYDYRRIDCRMYGIRL